MTSYTLFSPLANSHNNFHCCKHPPTILFTNKKAGLLLLCCVLNHMFSRMVPYDGSGFRKILFCFFWCQLRHRINLIQLKTIRFYINSQGWYQDFIITKIVWITERWRKKIIILFNYKHLRPGFNNWGSCIIR